MKRITAILLLMLLLCGCGHAEAIPTQTTTLPPETTQATTEAATLPPETEAPDPLITLLDSMSTEEKVGQLFLACSLSYSQLAHIEKYHLGGLVLFGADFDGETPTTIAETLADYQAASAIPLLIAVDEEGGTVCRVSNNSAFRSSRYPSPRTAFSQGGMDAVLATEREKAENLAALGINVNLAPVCDITTNSASFMYKRSLGQDAETTAQFITGTVAITRESGIGAVLKHFPGYGNNTDTHTGIALDDRTLEQLENCDLIPFQAGIDSGCGAILVSHTFVNCLDSLYPATLSPTVHTYLRQEMGFEGVIVTDDLSMGAITKLYGDAEAAVLAVLAGNDLLCTFSYESQYPAVLDAVTSGRISPEQLDASVLRILRWKQAIGLLP